MTSYRILNMDWQQIMVKITSNEKTPTNESEMKIIESTVSPIAVLPIHRTNNKS